MHSDANSDRQPAAASHPPAGEPIRYPTATVSPYFHPLPAHHSRNPPPPLSAPKNGCDSAAAVQQQPLNLSVLSSRLRRHHQHERRHDSVSIAPAAPPPLWQQLDRIEGRLNERLAGLPLPATVAAVYNPTVYARRPHRAYLERFLRRPPRVLFVGMNPGPWGMCQTGVPFGWTGAVRDWWRLADGATVDRPAGGELPQYPVLGLACERTEVSGKRFWTVMREVFGERPEAFFERCFVQNLCPLAMFEARGRNVTPAELRVGVHTISLLCLSSFLVNFLFSLYFDDIIIIFLIMF